ncbi:MAG: prolipoprotein diacylglyceryl transferase [Oscillospiraceae bacterium]|nr:prolipoprotein diacylglyceryl transferase [Oscillospiraceae bacterium]
MSGYTVQFPGLGWSFHIDPTVFSIGSFEVKWYGVLIGLGFLLAFVYGLWMSKRMGIDRSKLIDTAIFGLIGGIVGARLYYVLFYPGDFYWKHPLEIFKIHSGGLGIYGGIIGGLLVGMLLCKIKKINPLAGLDLASMGFLIGQCIGRWGNFVNQEAFGSKTNLPWGMQSVNTGNVPVHPCFFYESLWCAIGFVLLHLFTTKLRRYDGQTFLLYVIWYGTGRFFIEALRTDSLYVPGLPIKVSQLVALVSVAAAVVLLLVFRKRKKLSGVGSKAVMAENGLTLEALLATPDSSDEKEKKKQGRPAQAKEAAAQPKNDTEETIGGTKNGHSD